MSKPVVGYIGAFWEHYPRNQVIRAGLEAYGWEVWADPILPRLNTIRKLPLLWRSMHRLTPYCEFFILAEFNQLIAPFAVWFGRLLSRPVIVDYLVGLYDAIVQERETIHPNALRARLFRLIDRWNCAHAPLILTDTTAHRAAIREIVGKAADRLTVVPVGVYDKWWNIDHPLRSRQAGDPLLVQFFGSYIPFHGVDIILKATHLLADDSRFRFELIGRGKTYPVMRELAESLGISNVVFVDNVPPPELPERVAQADICLGVFGQRAKTDYVVPNKLFQYMALGKPVITADSAAVREFFEPGVHLVTVPPGSASALANALQELADDPDRRRVLGETARAQIRAHFFPSAVTRVIMVLAMGLKTGRDPQW